MQHRINVGMTPTRGPCCRMTQETRFHEPSKSGSCARRGKFKVEGRGCAACLEPRTKATIARGPFFRESGSRPSGRDISPEDAASTSAKKRPVRCRNQRTRGEGEAPGESATLHSLEDLLEKLGESRRADGKD